MFNRRASSVKRETASKQSKQIQAASLSLASANSNIGITRREAITRTSTSRSTIGRSLSLGRKGLLAALNGEVAPQSPSNGGSTSFMKVFSTKLSGPPLKTAASTIRRTEPNQTKLEHSEVSPGAAAAAMKNAERANCHRRSSRQDEVRTSSSGRRLSHSYATLTTASLSSSSDGTFSSGSRSISPAPRRRARSKSRPMSPSPYQRHRGANRQPTLSPPPPRHPLSLHKNRGGDENRSRKRSVTPSPRYSGSRRVEDVLPPRSREQPLQGRSRKVEVGGGGERSRRRRSSPPAASPPGYLNWRKGDANRRFQHNTSMRQVSPLLRRSASNGRSSRERLPSMSRLPPPLPFCLTSDEHSTSKAYVFSRRHSDSFPVNGGAAGAPKGSESRGHKGVVQRRHTAEGKLGHGTMSLPPPSPPPRTQSKVLRSEYAKKQLLAIAMAKRDVASGSVASQEFGVTDEKSKTSEESPLSLTNWVHKRCSDINGFTGQYIGEVNSEGLMHGFGIMFYDFGLQHDGMWVNGLWEEATHDAANWNLTGQSSLGTSDRSSRGGASTVSSLSPSFKQSQMNHMVMIQSQRLLRSTVQGVGCPLTPPPKQIMVPGQQHQGEAQTQDESNGMHQFKRYNSLEGSTEVHLPLKPPAPVEQDSRPPPLTEIKVKVKMPPPPPPPKQQQEQEHDSSNPTSSVMIPPPPPPKDGTMSSIQKKGQDNSSPIAKIRVVQVPPPPKRTTEESPSIDEKEQEDGDIPEEATYDNIMLAATKWLIRAKHIDQEGEGECVDIPKEVTYDNLERAKRWLSGSKQIDQEEEQDGGIPEDVTYNSLVLAAAAMTDTGMVQSVCSGTLTKNSLLSGQSGSQG